MDMTSNMIFQLGVEAGRKQMMNHIQYQCSIGKPVECNGELYWLTDSRKHLHEIMDDIYSEHDIQKKNHYVVPIQKFFDGKCIVLKVIVPAETACGAWGGAIHCFEKDGWYVFPRYDEYEQI